MDEVKPENQIYDFPDQVPIKTWEELIQLSDTGLTPHGAGISPRKPIQSSNFVEGVSGYRIDTNGNVEFQDGIFRGNFSIGGTTITIDNTEDIQENLDTIDTAGGGTLFLQNGTYTLTADISIPSGVTLQGVSRDGVILDCDGTFAMKIAGTNVYSTGTVTLNNGDTTVTGSGTIWTAAMVGRYILLDGLWYEITARASNTSITIATYQGDNLSGAAYVLADTNFSATLRNVIVTGATGSGVVVQYAQEPNLNNLVIYDCGTGIEMDYVVFPQLEVTSIENGVNLNMNFVEGFSINFSEFNFSTTGAGVIMTNTRNSTLFNSSINDNTGDGLNMTTCSKIATISFDISGNGGQGLEMVSACNDNQMTDGVFDGNTSDGIKLTATSDRNVFVAISITDNGGYGINIAASTCDNNQIIAPAFDNNSSGDINDSGTGTFVSPQTIPTVDVFIQEVSLSANQIKALHTTPVTLIAAQGAGTAIVVSNAIFSFTVGTQYLLGDQLTCRYNGDATNIIVGPTAGNIQGASSFIQQAGTTVAPTPIVPTNVAFEIKLLSSTAFTTGTGTLKVFITYSILTL